MTLFLLDTNTVSSLIIDEPEAARRASAYLGAGHELGLSLPVHYEILRRLIWRAATRKLRIYTRRVIPLLTCWVELVDSDWEVAAHLWADARKRGRQLSDPDIVLAALVQRTGAVLVSSDADFDVFSIRREDWRK